MRRERHGCEGHRCGPLRREPGLESSLRVVWAGREELWRASREDGAMAPILWKNKCSAAANSVHNPLYLRFAIQPYSRSVCGLAAKSVWNFGPFGTKKGGFIPYPCRRLQAAPTCDSSDGGSSSKRIELNRMIALFKSRRVRRVAPDVL